MIKRRRVCSRVIEASNEKATVVIDRARNIHHEDGERLKLRQVNRHMVRSPGPLVDLSDLRITSCGFDKHEYSGRATDDYYRVCLVVVTGRNSKL